MPDPYWLACLNQSGLKEKDIADEIYAYQYKGQTVFLVKMCTGCSDSMTQVYACGGQVICAFGGIAGFNTCPDFANLATQQVLVFKRN